MWAHVYSSVSSSVVALLMDVAEMNTNRIMIRLCKFLIAPGSDMHLTSLFSAGVISLILCIKLLLHTVATVMECLRGKDSLK